MKFLLSLYLLREVEIDCYLFFYPFVTSVHGIKNIETRNVHVSFSRSRIEASLIIVRFD